MRYLFILFFIFSISKGTSQSHKARKQLAVLTSDSLAGRGFVENGQEKAASFIINSLKKHGAIASGEDGYKQELSYPVNTFPGNVQFSVENQNAIKIYAAGKDYLFHSASAPIDIKDEIKEIAVDHKFKLNTSNEIFYLEKTDDNRKETEELTQSFLFHPSIKGKLLIIQDSSKWSWFPSPKQGGNTVLYIKDKLKKDAEITAVNEASFEPNFRSSNIIGKIKGKRSDSVMMLSAHYDHLGQMGDAVFRGANDNASGVAMLLALAKYYGRKQPKFDTYFLFTTAEEVGLLGSSYFIKNPPFDLTKIKMLVNLDMVGTGEEGITVVNAKAQSRYFELLQKLNKGRIAKIKMRGKACNSDHCFFDQIGIPAVFIYTLGGKQAYHDVNDNGENLSLEAFDELHDILIESLNDY